MNLRLPAVRGAQPERLSRRFGTVLERELFHSLADDAGLHEHAHGQNQAMNARVPETVAGFLRNSSRPPIHRLGGCA